MKKMTEFLAEKHQDTATGCKNYGKCVERAANENMAGLAEAIRHRHTNVVDFMLRFENTDTNVAVHPEESSLLCLAVEYELETIVEKLLAKGAHINGRNKSGQTVVKSPLMYAAEKGNVRMAEILCEAGADVNLTRLDTSDVMFLERQNHPVPESAIYYAAREGHVNCLNYLLSKKPKEKAVLIPGYVALLETMCNGSEQCVRLLMENGLSPIRRHEWPGLCCYPLSKACKMGYVDCVKTLIAYGANVNSVDRHGPALEYCLSYRQFNAVRTLLDAGAAVNISPGRQSPLWYATQHGDVDIVRELLKRGAKPNARCSNGETAIFIAANLGHVECLKAILQHKDTMVNITNDNGSTAVIGAIRNQKLDSVSALLASGLNPNLCQPIGDKYSRAEGNLYPIMWAVTEDYPSCVDFLLSHGADPSLVSVYGLNSYQHAVSQDRPKCLQVLLEHETARSLFAKQAKAKSVLQKFVEFKRKSLGKHRQHVGISELLVESVSTYPRTTSGCAGVLLSHGADINYRNKRMMSSLDFAAERLMMDHVRLLLWHNADITAAPKPRRNLFSYVGVESVLRDWDRKSRDVNQVKMLLLAAGYEPNQKYQKVPDELVEFSDILAHHSAAVCTLLQLGRKAVRDHLIKVRKGNLFCIIPQLCLPKTVIDFLLYGQTVEEEIDRRLKASQ